MAPIAGAPALLLIPTVLGILTATDASPAVADAETDADGERVLVETATVRARPANKATAEVTVIDRDQIDALNPVSVAELIQFATGLNMTGTGSRGGIATAQVRGGDPNFTVVMVDGVPLNDSTDVFGGAVNLNALPVTLVERVEVVRGPQSSFLGSFGLAGAINIITRRGETERTAVDIVVGAGNADLRRTAASASRDGETVNWFVGASWDSEDGRVADERFEQAAAQATLEARLSPAVELGLSGRVTSWEIDDYREASGGPVYGSGELREGEHDELSLGVDVWLGRSDKRHLFRATLYRQELDLTSPAIPPAAPPSIEHTEFTDLQLGWNLPVVLDARDSITVGAQVRVEDGTNDSTLFLPFAFDGSYELDRRTPGAYVEWLGQRGPVLIELGARVDFPEDDDTQLSPRLGVAWQLPGGATRLRTAVSRGFKLPSFFALASPSLIGGNPDLEPEVSYGADLGVEHRFAGAGVKASLTAFHTDYDDLIDFVFDTFRFENLANVRARGVELASSWASTEAFTLRFNATWQDVENRDTDEELRHRPDWVLGGRFTWRFADQFRWEVDGRWKSSMRDEQVPVPDRDTVPSWGVFGATFAAELSDSWDVRVRVANLFDHEYETFIGFPGADRFARIDFRCKARSFASAAR